MSGRSFAELLVEVGLDESVEEGRLYRQLAVLLGLDEEVEVSREELAEIREGLEAYAYVEAELAREAEEEARERAEADAAWPRFAPYFGLTP